MLEGDRLTSNEHLARLHQVAQDNIPTPERVRNAYFISVVLSRASGRVVRQLDRLAENLCAAGLELSGTMDLNPTEERLLASHFAGGVIRQCPNILYPSEQEELARFAASLEKGVIPPSVQLDILTWWVNLQQTGHELGRIFYRPTLVREEVHQIMTESARSIILSRPRGITVMADVHWFNLHPIREGAEAAPTKEKNLRLPTKRQLGGLNRQVKNALFSYDLLVGQELARRHKPNPSDEELYSVEQISTRCFRTVNRLFKKACQGLNLNSFETYTLLELFKLELLKKFWQDIVYRVHQSSPQGSATRAEIKKAADLTTMPVNITLDEIIIEILIRNPQVDESKLRDYFKALQHRADKLADILRQSDFSPGEAKEAFDIAGIEIRGLRVQDPTLDTIAASLAKRDQRYPE